MLLFKLQYFIRCDCVGCDGDCGNYGDGGCVDCAGGDDDGDSDDDSVGDADDGGGDSVYPIEIRRTRRLIRPAPISGFCSMKRLGVFLFPPDGILVYRKLPLSILSPKQFAGWRGERGTVRDKCFA